MTAPTLILTPSVISYIGLLLSVPIITSNPSPPPLITQRSTFTTGPTSRIAAAEKFNPTPVADRSGDGLSNSKLTAIIVVPIVLLAILSPILIVWFLSWRRRRRHRSYNRRSIHNFGKEKGNNTVDSPLQARQLRSTPSKRSTSSLPPPRARQLRSTPPKGSTPSLPPPLKKPFTVTPDERESTQRFCTSQISNNSLSGFNFDFSHRASMFSALSTQPTIRDPNLRPSSAYTWILPPPSASRPMTLAQPYIPSRIRTPNLPESPLAPQELDNTSDINPEVSSQPRAEVLPHPDNCGKVYTRTSSIHSLSVENLFFHNGSNLQAPFSQPHLDAMSDISGLSFDHALGFVIQQPQCAPDAVSEVSVLEPDPSPGINPHQIV
ncbi:hypothetical protein MMC29_004363 [Sticta canariensis]|nr:hypothetical protein [Sticta canariensis]